MNQLIDLKECMITVRYQKERLAHKRQKVHNILANYMYIDYGFVITMQKRVISFTSETSSRIIYQSKKLSWYVWLLILSKFLRCSGLYLAFDVIGKLHVINFVWVISLICSLLFGIVQRPFVGGKEINFMVWLKIAQYSLVQNGVLVLFFYGLSQAGPFRTALLTENSDIVILAVLGAVFKGVGGPSKLRGALMFILAIFALVLFDNDSTLPEHPEGHSHHGVKHMVFYVISWMGLSDHEGGILILIFTTVLMMLLNIRGKFLALELGGSKRFNSLSWFVSFATLSPLAFLLWVLQVSSFMEIVNSIHLTFVIALLYFVFHFYVNSACSIKLTPIKTSQVGTIVFLSFSLLLSFIWPERGRVYHQISGGAIFSSLLFCIATVQLTTDSREFSELDKEDLLPFHLSSDALNKSHSIFAFLSSTLQSVLGDKNSRTIFYFLCINLGFTFVELTYGMWTNSLGLISDGFHMLFDCSALVMGLGAAVMAQWKPSKTFPYGYGRIEVLSGFVNGLFLSVIGMMVFLEAIGRLFEPPPIQTERLMAVAVCGLLVNLCGIFAFSLNGHGHSHGHSHSHSHGNKHDHHGHSHHCHAQPGSHGHSHAVDRSHAHSHNVNMEGVFLHVLADTLGSVAVIVSSFLIDWYGWLIADPICSLILSVLILASVFPLLKSTASVLLLGVPSGIRHNSEAIIEKVLQVESVLSCENPHFWEHCGSITVATINVYISGEVPEQNIMSKVTAIFQSYGFSHVTVQVEVAKSVANIPNNPSSPWELGSIYRIPKKRNVLFPISNV